MKNLTYFIICNAILAFNIATLGFAVAAPPPHLTQ